MEKQDFPYEFDAKKRRLASIYSKQKLIVGLFQGILLPVVFLSVIYISPFSKWLEASISALAQSAPVSGYWIIAVLYVIALMVLLFIVGFPISFYSGYKIEHDYDLSNQSIGGWVKDQIKSLSISLLITTPLITGVFYLGRTYPDHWWLFAGSILFVFMGVMSNIAHLVLMPLFFKTEILEDEELSERLKQMASDNGVKGVEKVIKVHASDKTEKANAGFAGMGKSKRIYLFDTLLDKFHRKEVEGVVAHEMGHYVNHDVLRYIVLEGLLIFPVFFLADRIFTHGASFDNIYHLPLFLLILYGLYSIIDPITLAYSRHRERQADIFALEATDQPGIMISAFKRLSDIDLAEIRPKRIVEVLFYSHPAPGKRLDMVREWIKEPSS